MRRGFAMWIFLVLLVSCGNKAADKVTREDCSKVADHVASLIINHYATHTDALWDGLASSGKGKTELPPTVTKETFKAYLDTPEGKTWLMKRQGEVRIGTEAGVAPCVKNATRKQVNCLLAAKTPDDITACDKAASK